MDILPNPSLGQPQITTPPIITPPKSRFPVYIFIIAGLLILTSIIGILVYTGVIKIPLLSTVPKKEEDLLLVSVGDRKIFLSEVQSKTEEVLVKSAINKKALQSTLDQIIEETILDTEARKLNIQVTDQEIAEKISQQNNATPSGSELKQYSTFARYQLIKERITKKEVASRLAYLIGFWVPPYDYPDKITDEEKTKYELMRRDGKKALEEVVELLKKGQTPLAVTEYIYNKYPSLQTRLALNGIIFNNTENNPDKTQSWFNKPVLFEFDEKAAQQTLYKNLYSMSEGEIRLVFGDNGAGGTVFKVESITNSDIHSYEDWLNIKKEELVKTNNTI